MRGESETRRGLGLDPGEQVVGMVAMMNSPVKGHEVFLRAAREILRVAPRTRFLVIGDGERRPVIEALSRELRLEGSVRLLGARTDVPRLLSVMDVFVQCQPYTGTNAVIEAMAAGRAVIMTSSCRDNETVHGEDGYIVRPGDYHQVAERTIELLCDTERAKRFGASGRRRVETNFSIAAMVKKFEDFYASL
jgi:glycosyltransferase involved in cell wall biosynthesis